VEAHKVDFVLFELFRQVIERLQEEPEAVVAADVSATSLSIKYEDWNEAFDGRKTF